MAFPPKVREEALVLAARRCCVCRRYRGVGVEVHHIEPKAAGGPDSLENAIVLCFDCHCAAGHYNDSHPKGTKFRPDELRRHRSEWHERVKNSKLEPPSDEDFAGYYSRHLICLDNEAARELLNQERDKIPFSFSYVLKNDVWGFMSEILAEKLPHTWASSDSNAGYYWGEPHYESLDELYENHPEFSGELSRELTHDDFSENGLVPSKMFKQIVDSGINPSELGNVRIEHGGCGGGAMFYVEMRRPLFVFAELKNTSTQPIRLNGLISRKQKDDVFFEKLDAWDQGELFETELGNITLEPGECVVIPECVLLSNIDTDDYSTDFVDWSEISPEQGQAIGFRTTGSNDDLMIVGPTVRLNGFSIEAEWRHYSVPIHSFDPNKCYLFYRAWMCGSCPHLYVFSQQTGWTYRGELLVGASKKNSITDEFVIPDGVTRVRIVETDFEESFFETIMFDGRPLIENSAHLTRGDTLEFHIVGPGLFVVRGRYHAIIPSPTNYLQLRQKFSLRRAYERDRLSRAKFSV